MWMQRDSAPQIRTEDIYLQATRTPKTTEATSKVVPKPTLSRGHPISGAHYHTAREIPPHAASSCIT